jgi:hypothetical protein
MGELGALADIWLTRSCSGEGTYCNLLWVWMEGVNRAVRVVCVGWMEPGGQALCSPVPHLDGRSCSQQQTHKAGKVQCKAHICCHPVACP